MHDQRRHDSSPSASATDAALRNAQSSARAAALAVDHLESAERSTKPEHARRWRLAGFGALQESKVLATRAMECLADVDVADVARDRVSLSFVMQMLEELASREGSMVGCDAIRRAAAHLVAKAGEP